MTMPMYDWRCTECDKRVTLIAAMADIDKQPDEPDDTGCKHQWQRLIAPSSFVLSGSGWFKDKYS